MASVVQLFIHFSIKITPNKAYFWGDQDVLHPQGKTSMLLQEVHEQSPQTRQKSTSYFSSIQLQM